MGTSYSEQEDTPGKIVPWMIRGNVSDDSVYWQVGTWKDGTFFLSNKANTTDYHLTRKPNSLTAMTSNISESDDLPGQHFSLQAISAIDDEKFSTVAVSVWISQVATRTNIAPASLYDRHLYPNRPLVQLTGPFKQLEKFWTRWFV